MKLKTHQGTKKRIKVTRGGKGGKFLRRHVRTSHLKTKQSPKQKRHKAKLVPVSSADQPRLARLLPYNN